MIFIGVFGYLVIEDGYGFLDSLYMTVIAITTTGFMEVKPLTPAGRILTIFLIFGGVVTITYTAGRFAQLVLENQFFRRKRMDRKVDALSEHFIVCGYGRIGKHICETLKENGKPFVVVEIDDQKIEELVDKHYLFVHGDATNDEVLKKARIEKARGLASVLKTDAENVFTVLSAKQMNPDLYVVTRSTDEATTPKLKKAGADRVIETYEISASRISQVLLRPNVMDFIDGVARNKNLTISLEEIEIGEGSSLNGVTLIQSPIRKKLDIIIIAIYKKNGEFLYNPHAQTVLEAGDILIAIGETKSLEELYKLCK